MAHFRQTRVSVQKLSGADPFNDNRKFSYNAADSPMKCSMLHTMLFILAAPILGAQAQDVETEVKRSIGQTFVLRGYGDQREVELKKADLSKNVLRCDSAVAIREASYSRDRLRLTLQHVGRVVVTGGGNSRDWCQTAVDETKLTVTDVKPSDLNSGVASLVVLLMTPEAYLSSNGIPFNLPPAGDGEPALDRGPGRTDVKALLQVTPAYNDEARKARAQGQVNVEFVVGTDGRVHSANVTKHPGYGLDKQSLLALSIWRFEPARQNGQAVAMKTTVFFTFNLR
jgi:TonB family protein